MSENRVQLEDNEVMAVAGGNIQFVYSGGVKYAYGTHNPDKKYGFNKVSEISKFVQENYDLYGEAGTLNAMVAAGICWEL